MPRERILITVKTYPTLSEKYGELVCTAGIREDGSWVRLYPVPFRRLGSDDRYQKFQWVETQVVRNPFDTRPESFRLLDPDDITLLDRIGTEDNWRERRRLLIRQGKVFDNMETLIEDSHANRRSLATFKPTTIEKFVIEKGERSWAQDKLDAIKAQANQGDLLSDEGWKETFKVVKPVPWKFSYGFTDVTGKLRTLQILDWEIGALYWNCLESSAGDEKLAISKVRQMYFERFRNADLHLFLGTTHKFHQMKAPNPWVIVGVLPVPQERQISLL